MPEQNKSDNRYAELVSVKYITSPPFNRTLIREQDPAKGQRETCLYYKNNEINSEVSGGINLF